jgi:hypothetical protein
MGKSQIFLKFLQFFFNILIFDFFWVGSNSAHVAGLDPTGLTGSLAQTSDPAGQEITHAISFLFK